MCCHISAVQPTHLPEMLAVYLPRAEWLPESKTGQDPPWLRSSGFSAGDRPPTDKESGCLLHKGFVPKTILRVTVLCERGSQNSQESTDSQL